MDRYSAISYYMEVGEELKQNKRHGRGIVDIRIKGRSYIYLSGRFTTGDLKYIANYINQKEGKLQRLRKEENNGRNKTD